MSTNRTGKFASKEYITWESIKRRCSIPKQNDYAIYGGAGIRVCDRWINSFDNFLADMGKRPKGMTIDRLDSSKNYSPENCRWATWRQQKLNQRIKPGKAGYYGLHTRPNGKYQVLVGIDRRNVSFGDYFDKIEAATIRDSVVLQLYPGEKIKLNFEPEEIT